jgi:uroporphyrinogen-III decarboxylase
MMNQLTSRERILRTMRRQETDFVPVSPRMWKFHTMYYGEESLDSCFRSKAEFDYDPIFYTETATPNLFTAIIPSEEMLPPGIKFSFTQKEDEFFRILERKFDTPAGPLTDCWKIPLQGPYDTVHLEYLLKSYDDLSRLQYLVNSPSKELLEQFKKMNEIAGQDILVTPYVRSPFNDMAYVQSPVESMILAMDDPKFINEMLDILLKPALADIDAHLNLGAEIIFISGFHISLSVGWSPKNYRDFFLPKIKEMVDRVHSKDAIVHLYDDGKVMDILPMMMEAGIDVFSTCTPPPCGDFDLIKAREIVNGKMTLMGYVDIENILHRGTPEMVEKTVREALESGIVNNSFILSSSDGILRQTPLENMKAYFKAGRKWGKK